MSEEDFSNAAGANGTSHMPGKHRGPRFSWTPAYEATFFRSLCESVHLGLREGSTFKQEAWERAISCLIKHHNAFAHKNHLINKSDNARKKFRLWRGLREDPEFRYDRTTRTVTASEDAWRRHIEVCRLEHQTLRLAATEPYDARRKSRFRAPSKAGRSNTKTSTRSCFPMSLAPAAPPSD